MSEKTFEVTVPIYGFITLDVTAENAKEAQEKALEDCFNIRADTSGMQLGAGSPLELLPYESIVEGNRVFVQEYQISSKLIDDE